MMYIMKSRILLVPPLQRIPRQPIPAVIVHALHHADGAEPHRLTDGETGDHERECGADGVEDEGFGEGVVEGTEGVGDVEAVVVGVHVSCDETASHEIGTLSSRYVGPFFFLSFFFFF